MTIDPKTLTYMNEKSMRLYEKYKGFHDFYIESISLKYHGKGNRLCDLEIVLWQDLYYAAPTHFMLVCKRVSAMEFSQKPPEAFGAEIYTLKIEKRDNGVELRCDTDGMLLFSVTANGISIKALRKGTLQPS